MHYVLDNNGKKYLIKEINKFYEHLIEFHTDEGRANNSLHEENGYYFTWIKIKNTCTLPTYLKFRTSR